MHDAHSIRVWWNDGGAADHDIMRIDIMQYVVDNGWRDAEQCL